MTVKQRLAGILCAFVWIHAHAHQIWIEPAGKVYSLHFGEYDENLKEVTPGLLDKMPTPVVSAVSGDKTAQVEPLRLKDGFVLNTAKSDCLIAEVRNYPTFERKNGDQITRGKWVPAARHANKLDAQAPANFLDIVPTGKNGRFAVYFRGKPLPKAKVTLVAPNGWQKQLQSDQNGEVEVTTLWRGLYLLEVAHKENSAGEIGGEAYDSASFTSTLTFNSGKGDKTPRPKAAKPNAMTH